MRCSEAQELFVDHLRRRLEGDRSAALRDHFAECAACVRASEADRLLDELLDERLPQYSAPRALKRSLQTRFAPKAIAAPRRARTNAWLLSAAAAIVAMLMFVTIRLRGPAVDTKRIDDDAPKIEEAVNDHLRVLDGERPLDVQSSDLHAVKPWFAGKLDFAPKVAFVGDQDFPLQGGTITRFLDRQAAVFVYKRRLHVITLLVFRSEGMTFREGESITMGRVRAHVDERRGFRLISWRDGELAYVLISDVDGSELLTLGAKIAG